MPTLSETIKGAPQPSFESATDPKTMLVNKGFAPEEADQIISQGKAAIDAALLKGNPIATAPVTPLFGESSSPEAVSPLPSAPAAEPLPIEGGGTSSLDLAALAKEADYVPSPVPHMKDVKFIDSIGDLESTQQQVNTLLESKFDADPKVTSRIAELNKEISNAASTFKTAQANAQTAADKQKVDQSWANVAETLGNAFLQIGAGVRGLKTGVDLSGVKFSKTDWIGNLANIQSELTNKLSAAKQEFGVSTAVAEGEQEKLQKGIDVARQEFGATNREKAKTLMDITRSKVDITQDKNRAAQEAAKLSYQGKLAAWEMGEKGKQKEASDATDLIIANIKNKDTVTKSEIEKKNNLITTIKGSLIKAGAQLQAGKDDTLLFGTSLKSEKEGELLGEVSSGLTRLVDVVGKNGIIYKKDGVTQLVTKAQIEQAKKNPKALAVLVDRITAEGL